MVWNKENSLIRTVAQIEQELQTNDGAAPTYLLCCWAIIESLPMHIPMYQGTKELASGLSTLPVRRLEPVVVYSMVAWPKS